MDHIVKQVIDLKPGDTLVTSSTSTGLLTHGGRTVKNVSVFTDPWGKSVNIEFTDGVTATEIDTMHTIVIVRKA